jgi:hypothetical protein
MPPQPCHQLTRSGGSADDGSRRTGRRASACSPGLTEWSPPACHWQVVGASATRSLALFNEMGDAIEVRLVGTLEGPNGGSPRQRGKNRDTPGQVPADSRRRVGPAVTAATAAPSRRRY